MVERIRCWQKFRCGKYNCPAYGAEDFCCWTVSQTYCRDEIQGTFREKLLACLKCDFFQENAYVNMPTAERTIKFMMQKLLERCSELEKQREALNNKAQELMALNNLFIQLLDRERQTEEAHMRLLSTLKPLLESDLV